MRAERKQISNGVEVREEAMCWRKANAIHKRFVENVQGGKDDCGEYPVSHKQLKQLLGIINQILEGTKTTKGKIVNGSILTDAGRVDQLEDGIVNLNPELAQSLLPTESGFFFGSTNYDQWYLQDLEDTKERIEKELKEKKGNLFYTSSW